MQASVYKDLIPQQNQALIDVWKLLRRGVKINKFGKDGKPRYRYLFTDVDFKRLFWRSSEKERPSAMAENEDVAGEVERERERRMSVKRSLSPRRPSVGGFFKSDAEREMFFEDVLEVYDTAVTDTLKHAMEKDLVANPDYVISIATASRTLDFEVSDEDFPVLSKGLKIYVDALKRLSEHFAVYNSELDASLPLIDSAEEEAKEKDEAEADLINNRSSVVLGSTAVASSTDIGSPTVASSGASVNEDSKNDRAVISMESRDSDMRRDSDTRTNTRMYSSISAASEYSDPNSVPLPLRSLNPVVVKNLIAQQRQLLVDLWSLLRSGIQILKHTKNTRPHMRYLYCDVDMKKLYWRTNQRDKPSPVAHTDSFEGELEREKERRKSVRTPLRRRSSFGFGRYDADREMFFEDIVEVI
jgi:hypothetical protein